MTTGGNLSGGTYKIINVHSGLAMEAYNWSTSDGGAVDQWTYLSDSNQQWNVTYLNNGLYQLTNVHSGKVLDVTTELPMEPICSSGRSSAVAIRSTS